MGWLDVGWHFDLVMLPFLVGAFGIFLYLRDRA